MPLEQGKPLLPSRLSTGVQGDPREQTAYWLLKEDLRLTRSFPVIFPSALRAGWSFLFFYLFCACWSSFRFYSCSFQDVMAYRKSTFRYFLWLARSPSAFLAVLKMIHLFLNMGFFPFKVNKAQLPLPRSKAKSFGVTGSQMWSPVFFQSWWCCALSV